MLWDKILRKNWMVYKRCLKAGIGPAGIYRLRDGEIRFLLACQKGFFVLESFLDRAYKQEYNRKK